MQAAMEKPNILFICTVNRMRSATAERMYADDERFYVDSAGTDLSANVQVEDYHLEWADVVVVMEPMHRRKLKQMFPDLFPSLRIVCLHIPDEYGFMESALVNVLRQRFERAWEMEIMPSEG